MKNPLILLLALPMVLVCCSVPRENSDGKIVLEQISSIGDILSSNTLINKNSYNLGEVGVYRRISLSAEQAIYKNVTYKYIYLYANNIGGCGSAVIVPQEINELCADIDSIMQYVDKAVDHVQTVSFKTPGGLNISATNIKENNTPWHVTIELNYQGNASITFSEYGAYYLRELKNFIQQGGEKLKSL